MTRSKRETDLNNCNNGKVSKEDIGSCNVSAVLGGGKKLPLLQGNRSMIYGLVLNYFTWNCYQC